MHGRCGPCPEWVRERWENAVGRRPALPVSGGRMAAVAKSDKSKRPAPPAPRVLIVDDEPNLVEAIGDVVGPGGMGCRILSAASIAQAAQPRPRLRRD